MYNELTRKIIALYLRTTQSLNMEQQAPGGTALVPAIPKVKLEPRREETDCIAHEHDLVADSLSDIYGRNGASNESVFQVSS